MVVTGGKVSRGAPGEGMGAGNTGMPAGCAVLGGEEDDGVVEAVEISRLWMSVEG